jgi:hypothetical protein
MCQHVPPSPYPASIACYTAHDRGRSAELARSLLTELFRLCCPSAHKRVFPPDVLVLPAN